VTLEQFGMTGAVPFSGGSKEAFILWGVKSAKDHRLIELAQHVGFDFEDAGPPGIEPPFWQKGMFRVFVSHLSTHKALAGDLQTELLPYGISAFVAHSDIAPTTEWILQIETALATCEALVAVMHDGFHESSWTDQEIGFAMGRSVPIFAVHYGKAPYGFIGRFQAFGGKGKSAAILATELFNAFRKHPQTQKRVDQILVGLFEGSFSFASARTRIGYLEELEAWDTSFNARLQSAAENDSQVGAAFGVPERVAALIKKHS